MFMLSLLFLARYSVLTTFYFATYQCIPEFSSTFTILVDSTDVNYRLCYCNALLVAVPLLLVVADTVAIVSDVLRCLQNDKVKAN